MIPDDAINRLHDSASKVAKFCDELGVKQWEIIAEQGYGHSVELEGGKITMASGGGSGGIGVRVLDQGKYGYAHFADVKSAKSAIERALNVASKSPAIDGFELPSLVTAKNVEGLLDQSVLSLSPEDVMEQADNLLGEVKNTNPKAVVTGGGIGAGVHAGVLVNSNGIEESGMRSSHGFSIQVTIDENGEQTSSYEGEYSRSLIHDFEPTVSKAVHWAEVTRNPIKGQVVSDCEVLMTSEGLAPLFSMVFPSALLGERMARKESLWSEQMGSIVLDNHLSIFDDRLLPGGISSTGRDAEGVPSRSHQLVENGALISSLWSVRDSAQMVDEGRVDRAQTTGSAVRGSYQGPPSVGCSNLILKSSAKTKSLEDMIQSMDDGYVVHSVMGAHTANPTSGDFSVTSSAILKVENGTIIGALKQAGLSGNLAKAFSKNVHLSNDTRRQGSYSSGSMYLPDVLLKDGLRVNPA